MPEELRKSVAAGVDSLRSRRECIILVEPLARSTGHQTWYATMLAGMIRETFRTVLITFDGLHEDADLEGTVSSEALRVRHRLPTLARWIFGIATGTGDGGLAAPSQARSLARIYIYNQAATICTVVFALHSRTIRRPALIHFLCPPALPTLLCIAFNRSSWRKVVITAFDSPEKYSGALPLLRRLCRRHRMIVEVQTDKLRQQWAEQIGEGNVFKVVLRCPAELQGRDRQTCRRALQLPIEGKIIAVIGALMPNKGYPELFAALKNRPRTFRVLLIGDTPDSHEQELEETVELAGWKDNTIVRRKFVPEHLMPSLFCAIDAGVLLYRNADASSGILALCRRYAVPVVATSHGEIGRMVREESLGITADPSDPAAVYEAVCRVLDGSAPKLEAAEAARLYEAAAEAQREVYRKLLAAS